MKEENKQDALLKTTSIFYKIKKFFRNLFSKKDEVPYQQIDTKNTEIKQNIDTQRNSFLESIKTVEDDETRLLKLQKQYRSGEIKEEDLKKETIDELCNLYDKQIANLRKSNEIRKQKILKYKNLQNHG